MRRVLTVVTLCALPISALSVAFAGPAAAAGGVSCTKLTATATGTKGTVSGCTDTANTGGKGTFNPSTFSSGSGTVKWNGTGTTTLGSITETTVTPNACPAPATELEVSGTVTGGTGAAAKSIKKGWTFQAFVCYNTATGKITLLKGTKVNIGPKF